MGGEKKSYFNIHKRGRGLTAQRRPLQIFKFGGTKIGTHVYRVRTHKKVSGARSETEQEVSHFDF